MRRSVRWVVVPIVGLALTVSLGAGLRAQESTGADTTAVAINTKDGTSVVKISFQILRNGGDVVDTTNIAFAFASCDGCTAMAISFQVVLITGDPSVASPENYAIAINWECSDCLALAEAYQWALSTGGQVHFTAEGNQALAALRQRLYALRRDAAGMTPEELQAELDAIAAQLAQILADELAAAGPPGTTADVTEAPSPDSGSGATTGTEPAETPPPTGSTTESPAPTETMSPSPTVSPTESPTG